MRDLAVELRVVDLAVRGVAKRKGFGSRHYPFGDPAHRKIDYTKFNCKVAHSLADSTISFWTHPTYTLEHIAADVAAFKKVAAAMMK